MSGPSGRREISVTELGRGLPDGTRTLLLGAPEIGKSGALDDLDETGRATVVRTVDDLTSVSSAQEHPVVFDDFYDLFSRYCRDEIDQRAEFQASVSNLIESDTTVAVCTTPYRLRWMLRERRGTFEQLLGEPTAWSGVSVRVDEEAARAFLNRELPAGVDWTTDQLRETEWEYPFEERFDDCLGSDESAADLLGKTTYWTYLPSMLIGDGVETDIDAILDDRESILSTIRDLLGDVAKSEATETSQGLLASARAFADTLHKEGILDNVQDRVEGMLSDSLDAGLGAVATTLSPAILPIACVAYWAYATRTDNGTKETVRAEFRTIFSRDILTLPAAKREELEEELNLAPRTLYNLNQVASGVTLECLQETIEDVGRAHDRIDGLEVTVENHEATIERIEEVLKRRKKPKTYQRISEFEADNPSDRPAYEVPMYEVEDAPKSVSVDADDPRDALEAILDREDGAVVLLTGESGIGKTRLMIEVAERLHDDGTDVRFVVDNPPTNPDPPMTGETVLFVDEVGRKSNPEDFLDFASLERRRGDDTVQVVATVRPVYEETVHKEFAFDKLNIPSSASRYDIGLKALEEQGTENLLSDLVDPDLAEEIHEATDGNPGLARLLARPASDSSADTPSIKERFERIVEETILDEVDLLGRTDVIPLLTAVAFLGEYDVGSVEDVRIESLSLPDPGIQRTLLRRLSETAYLDVETSDDRLDDPMYTHRFDILAEYLRYRDLTGEAEMYRQVFRHFLETDAAGITRGLLELGQSTLRRFEFVDDEALGDAVREELERVANAVVDSEAPLADILEVQALVALRRPDAIPHEALKGRYDEAETPGVQVAERLGALSTALYRHAGQTAELREAGVEASDLPYGTSSDLFGHARSWLTRLEDLHDQTDTPDISVEFAKGLFNAIVDEGEADNLETVQDLLAKLEDLHQNTGNPDISLRFAKGLFNAINYDGEADNLETVQDLLAKLEDLHQNTGNPDISVAFAKGLFNAIVDEGEADNLETVQDLLAKLEDLHQNTGNPDISVEFAKGLFNAINAEEDLDQISTRLDDLSILAKSHPDNVKIVDVATLGHVSTLDHYTANDANDRIGDAIDSLDSLAGSVDRLGFGAKSDIARAALEDVTEHLLRAGRFDRFETLADALQEGLPAEQWTAVSTDIGAVATDLHTWKMISVDEYRRVMEATD